jgi:hypothetical protein
MRQARRATLPLVVREIEPAGSRSTSATSTPCRSATAARIAAIAGAGSARAVPAARSATITNRSAVSAASEPGNSFAGAQNAAT